MHLAAAHDPFYTHEFASVCRFEDRTIKTFAVPGFLCSFRPPIVLVYVMSVEDRPLVCDPPTQDFLMWR